VCATARKKKKGISGNHSKKCDTGKERIWSKGVTRGGRFNLKRGLSGDHRVSLREEKGGQKERSGRVESNVITRWVRSTGNKALLGS